MAEGVGFEPTGLAPFGVQDRRIRPLCHPSAERRIPPGATAFWSRVRSHEGPGAERSGRPCNIRSVVRAVRLLSPRTGDHQRPRLRLLALPAVIEGSELSALPGAARGALPGIRTRRAHRGRVRPPDGSPLSAALTSTLLDARTGACLDSADIEEDTGDERDEYPSESIQRSGGRCEPERRRRGNGPGSLRTEHGAARAADVSRLRRRAPAIQGSADRSPWRRG